MTADEVREHPEYARCMIKILKYKKGFEFTLPVATIPKPQWNALKIVLRDAEKNKWIECISFSVNINGETTEMTYRRI